MSKYFSKIGVVFRKEWRDALRDKRSLRMAFLMPVYFVAMFVASSLFFIHMASQSRATTTEPIKLPVVGAEHLPSLIDWLQERGVKIEPAEEDAYQQVTQGNLDYVLIIPQDAHQKFLTGESIELALAFDATNNKIQGGLNFVRQQIYGWNGRIGSLRLLSRGIYPGIIDPVYVRDLNIASDQKMGIFVMISLPIVLILTAFISSIGFSADMTAGERERRSLESLLITPISSAQLIVGKWLNSFSLTILVLVVELILLAIAFAYIPFKEIGLKVDVTPWDLVIVFAVLITLAIIATPLQFAISIFARNFKDAQMHMSLMLFIPMIPLFYTMFNPSAYAEWFRWIPVLAQQVLIKDLLLGAEVRVVDFVKMLSISIFLGGFFLWFAVEQLRKPKIVYGI